MSEALSLAKYAYYSCSDTQKEFYNTKPINVVKVDLKNCCNDLILGKTDNAITLCAEAAKNGHVDCLKYARYLKFHWDVKTPVAACEAGQLECLKWAFENGCEWTKDVTWRAAASNELDCLKYALDNDCPMDIISCYRIAIRRSLKCSQCVIANCWDHIVPKHLTWKDTKNWNEMVSFLKDRLEQKAKKYNQKFQQKQIS